MIKMDLYGLRDLLSKYTEHVKSSVEYDSEFLDDDMAIEDGIEDFLVQEEAVLVEMEEPTIEESA